MLSHTRRQMRAVALGATFGLVIGISAFAGAAESEPVNRFPAALERAAIKLERLEDLRDLLCGMASHRALRK